MRGSSSLTTTLALLSNIMKMLSCQHLGLSDLRWHLTGVSLVHTIHYRICWMLSIYLNVFFNTLLISLAQLVPYLTMSRLKQSPDFRQNFMVLSATFVLIVNMKFSFIWLVKSVEYLFCCGASLHKLVEPKMKLNLPLTSLWELGWGY
jgi:hypothetical protein